MDNEILDFTYRSNFNFFKYRNELSENKKDNFLKNCQKIITIAHGAVREMLRLGLELAELKESGEWKEVINPEDGMTFIYSSFEAFSKYAFGFGKTKTSNLLSLSTFVKRDGNYGGFLYKDAHYSEMNTSQLIELAPLSGWMHKYFSPDLSVAEMRICKRYMNSGAFWLDKEKDDFDLLSCATRWTENLNKKKEQEEEQKISEEVAQAADDADGIEFFDGFDVPTSEHAEEERRRIEQARELAHAAGVPFSEKYADEEFDPYVFDGSMSVEDYELMHRHMEEDRALRSDVGTQEEKDERKYFFTTREGARKFLADYKTWLSCSAGSFFNNVYRYGFKNGMALFAATCKTCAVAAEMNEKETLFFFLHVRSDKQPIKISKAKLESWLKANEGSLL